MSQALFPALAPLPQTSSQPRLPCASPGAYDAGSPCSRALPAFGTLAISPCPQCRERANYCFFWLHSCMARGEAGAQAACCRWRVAGSTELETGHGGRL
ncbi:hypothetical protein GQ54DRAFT_90003 [Martensiomyces pterosporus]|nr:hypothetical protein GQ54DRAFT_90003 [Martensiomyces pterosporus]